MRGLRGRYLQHEPAPGLLLRLPSRPRPLSRVLQLQGGGGSAQTRPQIQVREQEYYCPSALSYYRFLDNGDFSPLGNDWSAKELLQLLEGLEQFGHGNWNDVAR